MTETYYCWKCAEPLTDLILPLSRREECLKCCADQHVCKMCVHFSDNGRCEEERAEVVRDSEKANFCDYFSPTKENRGNSAITNKSEQAKAQLAALFGDPEPAKQDSSELSPAELAEQKLRDMLGG